MKVISYSFYVDYRCQSSSTKLFMRLQTLYFHQTLTGIVKCNSTLHQYKLLM